MENKGNTALNAETTAGYWIAVIEADSRARTKLVMQLAGSGSAEPFETVDGYLERRDPSLATVAVFGPSFANAHGFEQIQGVTTSRPEVGAIVVADADLSTALLQQALHAGVRDAVSVQSGEAALLESVDRVGELVAALAVRSTAMDAPAALGRLIVSFSTKGGVGKSVVATNLAVSLARRCERPVALIDADLQFGDVAVLLGVPPQHTVVDAAGAVHQHDNELMQRIATRHQASGLIVLPAPVEPSAADQVRPEDMILITQAFQRFCEFVVVDMPPHFDDLVLALIEAADDVMVVASMDIPSIKNLKVGMQTLDLLSLAGDKLRLVLNRANAKVKLDVKEVEAALGMKAEFPIPSDIAVPQAVNRGVPVVLDNPKSGAARALEHIADAFVGVNARGAEEPEERRRRRRRG